MATDGTSKDAWMAAPITATGETRIKRVIAELGAQLKGMAYGLSKDEVDDLVAQRLVKRARLDPAWAEALFENAHRRANTLRKIARHWQTDLTRAAESRREHEQDFHYYYAETTARTWMDALRELEDAEFRTAIEQALDALPRVRRDVWGCRHLARLTRSEIAEHLGMPVRSVDKNLERATKDLQKALERFRDDRAIGGQQ